MTPLLEEELVELEALLAELEGPMKRSWIFVTNEDGQKHHPLHLRAAQAIRDLRARVEELEAGVRQIIDLGPKPFEFPSDWHEQIEACAECDRYKGHPIQRGICDDHRRPIWNREKHDKHEEAAIGYRAKTVARSLLPPVPEMK